MQSQLGIYTLSHKRGNDMLDLVGFSEVAKWRFKLINHLFGQCIRYGPECFEV